MTWKTLIDTLNSIPKNRLDDEALVFNVQTNYTLFPYCIFCDKHGVWFIKVK